jgi:hypothetical protein
MRVMVLPADDCYSDGNDEQTDGEEDGELSFHSLNVVRWMVTGLLALSAPSRPRMKDRGG